MQTGTRIDATGQLSPAVLVRFLPEGEEIAFRATGWGRYLVAAFLVFWLCGWVAGEVVVLGILFGPVLKPLLREDFPEIARSLPDGALPVLVLLFLTAWVVMWTLGGLGALHTLLRLLFGRDRFLIGISGVSCSQKPFGKSRILMPGAPLSIELRRRDKALTLTEDSKALVLTQGGTENDRLWLRDRLRRALGLPESTLSPEVGIDPDLAPREPAVPDGWQVDRLDGGAISLRTAESNERKSTGCAAVFATLWTLGVAWFFFKAGPVKGLLSAAGAFASFLFLSSVAVILLTVWVANAREHWTVWPGRLVWERRFAGRPWKKVEFQNATIAVRYSEDSDGDEWFELEVASPPLKRRILRTMNNSKVPVNLARLLAYHSRIKPRIDKEALEA